MASAKVYHAVGKRKSSIARVYMSSGTGQVLVNERPAKEYFAELFQHRLWRPFQTLDQKVESYDVHINVNGGGVSSQSDACMYGIAKALTVLKPEFRPELKKAMLLTRDSRIVERKKYGHKKARKSFQFSKR